MAGLRDARSLAAVLGCGLILTAYSTAQAAPPVSSGEQLPVTGRSVPADSGQLSEHNREWVMTQPPQTQAEFLLGAAINHDHGATEMITKMVDGWRGKLHYTKKFDDLQMTALYSNDLRVRAAAIEINLAVYNLSKTNETAERLMASADKAPSNRPFALWELGMLGNRGAEPDKIRDFIRTFLNNSDEKTRHWAVEGLAHLGMEDTIKDFVEVLHSDPSLEVRERAGCSLAKSGMFTREQRMLAVPELIEVGEDATLDTTTRSWVYQALREITNEHIGNDPTAWRNWWVISGQKRRDEFRRGDQWSVLGNN